MYAYVVITFTHLMILTFDLGNFFSNAHSVIIIIIIHKFHRDASLETKLQGRYVSRITLQL